MPSQQKLDRLYEGTLMRGKYVDHPRVQRALQLRHQANGFIDEDHRYQGWKVPVGVRFALRAPLSHAQIAQKYPWYVTWVSPKTGKRMRKYFSSLPHAIKFVATRASVVDRKATVVSRHGYDIPMQFRGRIPAPFKWCPCCMCPRKYKRVYTESGKTEVFTALVKVWSDMRQRYEYKERKLALMRCPVCGLTNRNYKFRRSNQPWEVRRVKPGARRVRAHHKTPAHVNRGGKRKKGQFQLRK